MSYFKAKMHQIRLRLVISAPSDPLAGFKGSTFMGERGGEGKGKGREGWRMEVAHILFSLKVALHIAEQKPEMNVTTFRKYKRVRRTSSIAKQTLV